MSHLWDGKTERRSNPSDHDNLTRTIVMLEGLVSNFQEHRKDFEEHTKEDNKKFDFLYRAVYIGFGAIGMLEIIMKFAGK